jgi:sodium ion-translocating decarboxylase beta subunit
MLVPPASPLILMLMFCNLIREIGIVERLVKTAQNELVNLITILLGLSVGMTMDAAFLDLKTLGIIVMGALAFAFATASGLMLAKVMNLFTKDKINPLIGAAGVSAVPMAARVAHIVGQRENPQNYLLMHAMGPNVAGVIGTAVAAGVLISLLS